MKLLSSTVTEVKEVCYTVEYDGIVYHYKELIDSKGKVFDCVVRDRHGNDIDDPSIFEEIGDFIDSLTS